jgi:hypothetical protein
LENTKQGEESFLVHAVETGVKVFRDTTPTQSRRVKIKIADGVAYCEQLTTVETRYRVQNSKGEAFQFEIEHTRNWQGSKLECSIEQGSHTSVDTPVGVRISTTLPATGSLVVTVTENLVQDQNFAIGSHWLQQNIIATNHPLIRSKSIQKVVELQQIVDNINLSINEANIEVTNLTQEQDRLGKLLPNVHNEQASRFRNEISDAETSLKALKKEKLPTLRKDLKVAQDNVQNALLKLKTNWGDEVKNGEEEQKQ